MVGITVLADPRQTYADVRRAVAALTPGARLRRALYYRYLLSGERPR